MDFTPPRRQGLIFGVFLLMILLGAIVFSLNRLATAPISPWITLWVTIPLVGVPLTLLIGYRLYGLLTARYRLDRDGFHLTWGLVAEQLPLVAISSLRPANEVAPKLRPNRGLWWPGCVYGRREVDGEGVVEFFATSGSQGILVLSAGDRLLAISPPDLEAFHQNFVDATRMGSLEPIPTRSQRPDFVIASIWTDTVARVLILVGLVFPLLLLGYLALRLPVLPLQVPFGFDPTGAPDPLAPPGRLLLLPMISGLCWLANMVTGVWLYRREADRPLAYAVWMTAVLVGGLFWGAALHLLAAA